jgi:hypothetical protein
MFLCVLGYYSSCVAFIWGCTFTLWGVRVVLLGGLYDWLFSLRISWLYLIIFIWWFFISLGTSLGGSNFCLWRWWYNLFRKYRLPFVLHITWAWWLSFSKAFLLHVADNLWVFFFQRSLHFIPWFVCIWLLCSKALCSCIEASHTGYKSNFVVEMLPTLVLFTKTRWLLTAFSALGLLVMIISICRIYTIKQVDRSGFYHGFLRLGRLLLGTHALSLSALSWLACDKLKIFLGA